MTELKKMIRVSLNARMTVGDAQRVNTFVKEFAKSGGVKLQAGDVYAAFILAAIENPEVTAIVRNYIKGRIDAGTN